MSDTNRRVFLQASAAAAASVTLLPGAMAAGNDTLRVGLVGCGGRGTGAAKQALRADPKVKLVAMCDAFMDRLDASLNELKGIGDIAGKIDVSPERKFDGFDGYKKLLEQVDVVLLCTPPGFRPLHLKAAIDAGKHVFCEKPVAVDVAGAKSVIETAKLAKQKNVSLCSGFCYRYDIAKRETVKRIHEGMIGDVLVEQHCHNFDKASWIFDGKMPVAATGVGGRQQRRDPKYGHIYDHFAVTLEYAN